MKHPRSALAVLALTCGASLATPAAAQSIARDRIYAGASVGQTTASNGCSGIVLPGINCNDSDMAWRLLGGYRLDKNFALEFGYQDLGQVKATGVGSSGDVTANVWELVAVGTLPIKNWYSVYGKLGAYRGEAEQRTSIGFSGSETNYGLTFGGGVRYDLSPTLALRAEYQSYQGVGGGSVSKSDYDVVSVGALVNFQ